MAQDSIQVLASELSTAASALDTLQSNLRNTLNTTDAVASYRYGIDSALGTDPSDGSVTLANAWYGAWNPEYYALSNTISSIETLANRLAQAAAGYTNADSGGAQALTPLQLRRYS